MEAIYSRADKNYDFGDEKKHQVGTAEVCSGRALRELGISSWKIHLLEQEYFHILLCGLRLFWGNEAIKLVLVWSKKRSMNSESLRFVFCVEVSPFLLFYSKSQSNTKQFLKHGRLAGFQLKQTETTVAKLSDHCLLSLQHRLRLAG